MSRNVLLLIVCQALLMTGVSLVLAASALVGAELAPSPILATAPLSLQYLATMLTVFPVSQLMKRYGRRRIFVGGALVGTFGVAIAALGIGTRSFVVFTLAGLFLGMHNAVGQSYRFAAADAVAPALRSRAISLTLAGGIVAALVGPNLARLTRNAMSPPFLGSFLALVFTAGMTAIVASRLRLREAAPPADPVAEARSEPRARSLRELARQPVLIVAVVVATLAYGTMNLLMTSTPLAMRACHHGFSATAVVIQWHLVSMFGPSLVTGDLVRRFGVLRVMAVGTALTLGCIAVNLTGFSVGHFEAALVLLGVGWNFLYISATTLLTESYRPAEKARVQGANDTIVFSTVALSSLASGGLVSHFGWRAINVAAFLPVAGIACAIAWLAWKRSSSTASTVVTAS